MKPFSGDPATAWQPFRPDRENPWDLKAAAHLFRRAGFGANWTELQRAVSEGPGKTIDRFFRPGEDRDAFNREADSFESDGRNAQPLDELRGAWLRRMIATPDPLTEKTTLFWHSWFGVSAVRTQSPALALAHVRTLRAKGLGCFDEILLAAVRDPGVLLSSGGKDNPKARPNLHLARQMLAVFTLGEGQFTEADVTDTARAFTGLFVRGDQLREMPHEHDDGEKTILGQTGRWTAADFARIAARHPALARRVVRQVYRWLISEEAEPSDELIEPLARSFGEDRQIGKLVETMLRSNLFFSTAAYRQRIKSPVEYAVGLCRAFEAQVPAVLLGNDVASLGQELYHPPTVKGWAGGRAWIHPATLSSRANFAAALLAGSGPYEGRLDPAAIARKHGREDPARAAHFLGELLLQGDLPGEARALPADSADQPAALRALVRLIAASPEYHLA